MKENLINDYGSDGVSSIQDELNNMDEVEQESQEDVTQLEINMESESNNRPSKRGREVEEQGEWTSVTRSNKRLTQRNNEVCIFGEEKLPKQFALAKLFQSHSIKNITKVKYINPYKVIIHLDTESSADKLIQCSKWAELGWRVQKPLEINISYGVIKDIDLDLSEEEMQKAITTMEANKLIAVKRLKRRNKEGEGWVDSETIRLGFKGSSLPAYVFIYDMRVKVESYIFPVTQCSKCWRYGHLAKVCPNKKIFCPKCGNNHNNCETNKFTCINCSGKHMALDKSCPVHLKEKRIRELMGEFNCSYRKAILLYVPPSFPQQQNNEQLTNKEVNLTEPASSSTVSEPMTQKSPSFAEVTRKVIQDRSKNSVNATRTQTHQTKNKKNKTDITREENSDWEDVSEPESSPETNNDTPNNNHNSKSETKIYMHSFKRLLLKLKTIFMSENESSSTKIKYMVKLFFDCLVSIIVDHFSELSSFLKYFNG